MVKQREYDIQYKDKLSWEDSSYALNCKFVGTKYWMEHIL